VIDIVDFINIISIFLSIKPALSWYAHLAAIKLGILNQNVLSIIFNVAIAMPIDDRLKGWFKNCLAGYR